MHAMPKHIWKNLALIVVATVALAAPSFATEQTAAPAVRKKSGGRPSPSASIAVTRPIVLVLLQAGTPGPITSSVIAGGGGSSSGGSFTINGTIGQAAAGAAMTGGNFSVTSGFWAGDAPVPVAKKRQGQITSQD
jgi:hypothetical protein